MKILEQQCLTIQTENPYINEYIKDYSVSAKYVRTNIQDIQSNIMNMTIPTEIVSSHADFRHAGLVNVTIDSEKENLKIQEQKHVGFEIYFVLNGSLRAQIENTSYCLQQYDAVIMNQNCKSMIQGGENLILNTIAISKEYLISHNMLKNLGILSYKSRYDDNCKDAEYVILRARDISKQDIKSSDDNILFAECKEEIATLIHQFHKEMAKKRIGYEQIVWGLLVRLLYSITNERLYETERMQVRALAGEELAESIKNYLDEHQRKITMEELTKQFHYNRNYLSKVFYGIANQTIKSYNNMKCMEEAKRLLEKTDLPVSLIAERLGFLSRSQFYKVFEETYGCTPITFRREIN